MSIVEAVYENGVLRLLGRVDLKDGERVKVLILKESKGLSESIRRISKEYVNVKEDPLRVLLGARR